ncbi:MAG TPA: response regulator [Planctomycetota bacterium]
MLPPKNLRILVVDDQEAIRDDFKKILAAQAGASTSSARLAFLGGSAPAASAAQTAFELALCSQGDAAVAAVERALSEGRRFAAAFVDVRMPPGIDGVQTIKRLWKADPDVEVVICTAYADYTFEQILQELGTTDRLLILKKPFEPVEVRQLANALTEKWNVTQRERSRLAELAEANERAQSASRAKSEFLANMSHEIRTPMNALLGYVDFLCDPTAEIEERARYAETIRSQSEHLLTILNDILDISRIEASRLVINRADVSPFELVKEVLTLMALEAGERDLRLELEVPQPIPEVIETDRVRVRQILLNLVGNALKFTPSGSVRVALRLDAHEVSDHRYLCIDVVDTGIGIAADKLQHIFEPFSQVDSSTTRRYGGTGLGLTISKRLALLLGGDIEVVSEPGRGSTFTVKLYAGELRRAALRPYTAGDCRIPDGLEPGATRANPGGALSGRVLVVEDVELNQRLLAAVLRRAGLEVDLACDGKQGVERALEALRAGRPHDLVLMDMQMPVMDGYSAARALRTAGYTRPIVALTAHAMSTDRERCLEAGCSDYETKPVQRERLLATCRRILAAARAPAALPAPAPETRKASA